MALNSHVTIKKYNIYTFGSKRFFLICNAFQVIELQFEARFQSGLK